MNNRNSPSYAVGGGRMAGHLVVDVLGGVCGAIYGLAVGTFVGMAVASLIRYAGNNLARRLR